MKVVLFIGHHKVGSSALQAFLARNSVALMRAGILYPSVDFQGCAVNIRTLLDRDYSLESLPINAREPHNALAFRMIADVTGGAVPKWHRGVPGTPQMLKAIRMQIQYLNPEVVILAAEVFSNFAKAAPSAIRTLAELFEGHEIHIISTLRRVDDYLVSWHGQRLKFGHQVAPLRGSALEQYANTIHFDFKLMLDKWYELFPDANFIIRNYADVLKSGGACEDFTEQSGISFPEGLSSVGIKNLSLHPALHEIARVGNKELKADLSSELKSYLLGIQSKLTLPKPNEIEMFGLKNRTYMMQNFERIHQYLSKKTKCDSFFPDIDEISEVRELSELETAKNALEQIRRNINSKPILNRFVKKNDACELSDEVKSLLMNIQIQS